MIEADDEATLHFIQFTLLAVVVGSAAKATAARTHRRRPQDLAIATLSIVAWGATTLTLSLACTEMWAIAADTARGWQMRALEAITVTAIAQLAYVLMLHRATANNAEAGNQFSQRIWWLRTKIGRGISIWVLTVLVKNKRNGKIQRNV